MSTGQVTWDEYRVKFLASKGFIESEIAEKIRNNEDLKLDEESMSVMWCTPEHQHWFIFESMWFTSLIFTKWILGRKFLKIEHPFLCPIITPAQEVLESLKDRWFQADSPPADQVLNEEEFLSFLHPEHSRGMLQYMVKEIVRDLGTSLKKKPWRKSFLFIYLTFTNNNIIYYGLHI